MTENQIEPKLLQFYAQFSFTTMTHEKGAFQSFPEKSVCLRLRIMLGLCPVFLLKFLKFLKNSIDRVSMAC